MRMIALVNARIDGHASSTGTDPAALTQTRGDDRTETIPLGHRYLGPREFLLNPERPGQSRTFSKPDAPADRPEDYP